MECIYGVMLLHAAKQPITEENIKKVLEAAGLKPDETRIKAVVAAVSGVNIDEAIKEAAVPTAAPAAPAAPGAAPEGEGKAPAKKEEKKKKEEGKTEEKAAEGLASLFG